MMRPLISSYTAAASRLLALSGLGAARSDLTEFTRSSTTSYRGDHKPHHPGRQMAARGPSWAAVPKLIRPILDTDLKFLITNFISLIRTTIDLECGRVDPLPALGERACVSVHREHS